MTVKAGSLFMSNVFQKTVFKGDCSLVSKYLADRLYLVSRYKTPAALLSDASGIYLEKA